MKTLYDTTTINGMTLKNRFIRSATAEGMSTEEGACTKRLLELYGELADGNIGLIITSHSYVKKEGQAHPRQLGIYDDKLIPSLRKLAEEVHSRGATIIIQLAHAGIFSYSKASGVTTSGPSAVEGFRSRVPLEMTVKEIKDMIEAFGEASLRARKAGFDGVQIHGAHGYLLSQFLSPAFNKRDDEYGTSLENRARIILEVIESIRKKVGQDYPVLIKMNCKDFIDGGLEPDEAREAAKCFEERGVDAIELSGGTVVSKKYSPAWTGINSEEKEAYYKEQAELFKKIIKIPLILVGGMRSLSIAEESISSETADYISMSRPFIREPDLIKRWASGDNDKATCISCNLCFGAVRSEEGVYCVPLRKEAL